MDLITKLAAATTAAAAAGGDDDNGAARGELLVVESGRIYAAWRARARWVFCCGARGDASCRCERANATSMWVLCVCVCVSAIAIGLFTFLSRARAPKTTTSQSVRMCVCLCVKFSQASTYTHICTNACMMHQYQCYFCWPVRCECESSRTDTLIAARARGSGDISTHTLTFGLARKFAFKFARTHADTACGFDGSDGDVA